MGGKELLPFYENVDGKILGFLIIIVEYLFDTLHRLITISLIGIFAIVTNSCNQLFYSAGLCNWWYIPWFVVFSILGLVVGVGLRCLRWLLRSPHFFAGGSVYWVFINYIHDNILSFVRSLSGMFQVVFINCLYFITSIIIL